MAVGLAGVLLPGDGPVPQLLSVVDGFIPQVNSAYRVTVFGPTQLLVKGQTVTVTGQVLNNSGSPLVKGSVGVDNGLSLMSQLIKTDSSGRFSFPARVNTADAAVVTFLVANNAYPFVFQSVSDPFLKQTNSLYISALAFNNATSNDLKCTTTVPGPGRTYVTRVPAKRSATVIRLIQTKPLVTWFGGGTFNVGAGVAGGSVAVTVDQSHVATYTTTGGVLILRGSVYATSQGDLGACWAPGGDYGVGPASLSGEVALCLGTDGISFYADASVGNAVGGFNVQLAKWS